MSKCIYQYFNFILLHTVFDYVSVLLLITLAVNKLYLCVFIIHLLEKYYVAIAKKNLMLCYEHSVMHCGESKALYYAMSHQSVPGGPLMQTL